MRLNMNLTMNQTMLTRKSILAAACFCFATSLTAQTAGRQESTSLKDGSAKEPQIVASLSHPASIPAMPLTVPGTMTPPPADSSAASAVTPVSSADVDTPQVKLLASSSLPTSVSLSAATAVRWSAVTPATDHSPSRKSWVSVEPGTLPPASLYQEAPSANPYGPAPAFVNLRFGHK
jgi:hypothetical protein